MAPKCLETLVSSRIAMLRIYQILASIRHETRRSRRLREPARFGSFRRAFAQIGWRALRQPRVSPEMMIILLRLQLEAIQEAKRDRRGAAERETIFPGSSFLRLV